jgi:hypothetical protein
MKNKTYTLPDIAEFCLLGLLGFLLFAGCRTPKVATTGEGAAASLKKEADFFHALRNQTFRYQTFSARMQVAFVMASGKEFSSRANLKIQKDKRLQISIQPFLGFEVFRVELSPDSVKVIDRMNKRYLADDYAHLKGTVQMDFNFHNLQALFTNQLFLPGETDMPDDAFKRFRWTAAAGGYHLSTKDRSGLQYLFMADAEEKLCAARITHTASHRTLHWDYTGFRRFGASFFPMNIHVHPGENSDLNMSLSIHYTQVDTDVPVEMNFPIPSDYERVEFSKMLKSFVQP